MPHGRHIARSGHVSHVDASGAIARIARGEMVIVVDAPDRENEGDVTIAAEHVTAEAIAFMLRHARGLVCMPCNGDLLDALRIGPMVDANTCPGETAFCVSIDHRTSTTGISAAERAATVRSVLAPDARPWDFHRPGHVFPLRARPGGVVDRPGHTEAAVDLARLAGLAPCAVICEVLNDDGSVARLDDLERFAATHGLAIASVDDLVEYQMASRVGAQKA